MANVNGILSYSMVDETGVRNSVGLPVRFADAVTLAQLDSAWAAMLAIIQAVTGASIQKGRVSFEQVVGAPPAPVADARVEEVGVFDFAITGSTHKQGIAVPGILDSLAPLGKINLAAGAISAFAAAIPAAITGGGVYSTPDGVALGALVDAFSATRKRRRQLRSLTFEL